MARRGRFSRGFVRGPRRAVDWSVINTPQTTLVALAGATSVLVSVGVPIVGGETVIRTRGLFGYASDQLAASEVQLGAIGICVVTAQAESVGISAVPHPDTDAAWGGWLYHSYFANRQRFASAVGFQSDGFITQEVDSKAMRKVDEDERLVMVVQNSGANGMDFYFRARFLSKIH